MRRVRQAKPLRHFQTWVCLTLCLLFASGSARADQLVADISNYRVSITSSFAGAELFVFGTIDIKLESDDPFGFPIFPEQTDIVIVLEGPPSDVTVRKKERIAGIWLNGTSVKFAKVPSFVHIASTRPLDEIAGLRTLKRHRIGLDHITPSAEAARVDEGDEENTGISDEAETGDALPDETTPNSIRDQVFRKALIWEKVRNGLYLEETGTVEMRSGKLFRARIRLPAQVPIGDYTFTFYLVRDGRVTAAQSVPLSIERDNIEHLIYEFAHKWPLFYGIFAVVIACLSGYGASMIFRKK